MYYKYKNTIEAYGRIIDDHLTIITFSLDGTPRYFTSISLSHPYGKKAPWGDYITEQEFNDAMKRFIEGLK